MLLQEIYKIDSRKSFVETWLKEMPSGLGQFETFDALSYTIGDFIRHGIKPRKVKDELFAIDVATTVLYWYGSEDGTDIRLAVELRKESEALVVTMLGKNRKYALKPPFASEMYSTILKDRKENIRIMSDKFLSDEGFAVWKHLVKNGHSVSVYDSDEPGKSFKTFDSEKELDAFFAQDDSNFERFQFVLSENVIELMQVRSSFNLRKHRESVNGLLAE